MDKLSGKSAVAQVQTTQPASAPTTAGQVIGGLATQSLGAPVASGSVALSTKPSDCDAFKEEFPAIPSPNSPLQNTYQATQARENKFLDIMQRQNSCVADTMKGIGQDDAKAAQDQAQIQQEVRDSVYKSIQDETLQQQQKMRVVGQNLDNFLKIAAYIKGQFKSWRRWLGPTRQLRPRLWPSFPA